MNAENDLSKALQCRIAQLHQLAPESIGDKLCFRLERRDSNTGEYLLSCRTESWMRNAAGTLHGGMCATILDQAMGFLAYCLKTGPGTSPTVQMNISYHRPLIPGEDALVKVRILAVTRSLISLSAEAYRISQPEKLCLSGSGIYFFKPEIQE